jgi:cytochrome c2
MFNKIAGAVLGTLLVLVALRIVAEALFGPEEPQTEEQQAASEATPAVDPTQALYVRIVDADPATGQQAASACQGCHTLTEGGATVVGPNLFNVVNRVIGSVEGFSYSSALQDLHDQGETWTYVNLDAWLTNTTDFAHGTAMVFSVSDPDQRAAIIAYLRTLSNDPAPLPEIEPGVREAMEGGEAGGAAAPAASAAAPAASAAAPDIATVIANADPAAGQQAVGQCMGCHTFTEGGADGIGPNLFGVVGRPAGGGDHNYTAALQKLNQDGVVWTLANLDEFLTDPGAMAPGTAMPISITDDTERHNVIAYLATLTTTPASAAAPASAPAASAAASAPASAPAASAAASAPAASAAASAPASAPAASAAANISAVIAAADPSAGQALAGQCMGCHTFTEGGADGIGPNLFGVVGRLAGSADHNYTAALQKLNQDGVVWTLANLNEFLTDPGAMAPGTAMPISITNDTDRHNLIAYLATLTAAPASAASAPAASAAASAPAASAPASAPAASAASAPAASAASAPAASAPAASAASAPAASAPAASAPAASAAAADISAVIAAADPTAGEAVSVRCIGCHTFDEGGADGVGPNLFGVVGRPAGGGDHAYTAALQQLNADGVVWTLANLDEFLTNPGAMAPGTAMPIAIPDDTDRHNLIAYLATLTAASAAAPAESAPASAASAPASAASAPAASAASAPAASAASAPAAALTPVTFTVVQGNWGELQYGIECATCHGDDLSGDRGPALNGDTFATNWLNKSVADLSTAMREGSPHPGDAVSDDDYAAIIAYILRENGFQAGSTALPAALADQATIGIVQ